MQWKQSLKRFNDNYFSMNLLCTLFLTLRWWLSTTRWIVCIVNDWKWLNTSKNGAILHCCTVFCTENLHYKLTEFLSLNTNLIPIHGHFWYFWSEHLKYYELVKILQNITQWKWYPPLKCWYWHDWVETGCQLVLSINSKKLKQILYRPKRICQDLYSL